MTATKKTESFGEKWCGPPLRTSNHVSKFCEAQQVCLKQLSFNYKIGLVSLKLLPLSLRLEHPDFTLYEIYEIEVVIRC